MMSKQSIMNKEFVPYTESLELEQLGFDEFCFAWYVSENYGLEFGGVVKDELIRDAVLAPTFSQTFRWFRGKYKMVIINPDFNNKFKYKVFNLHLLTQGILVEKSGFQTYEEAELACLKRLIEIQKGLESQQ